MTYENVVDVMDDKLMWTVSLCLFFLFLGDQLQEILFYVLWDFDDLCAFDHYVCLLDPSSGQDVVLYRVPFALLDHQVLPSLVKDARDKAVFLKLLDLLDDLLGGHLELVAQVFKEA